MAKNTLPVNFKDDIMNSSMGGKRKYKMINNSDGTISLEDATTYDQVGSNFGAAQLNATNQAVNAAADAGKIIDDIDAIRNVTKEGYMAGALALKQVDESLVKVRTYVGSDGKLHFVDASGADSVLPFSSEMTILDCGSLGSLTTTTHQLDKDIEDISMLFVFWEDFYTVNNLADTRLSMYTKERGWKNIGGSRVASATGKTLTLKTGNGYATNSTSVYYI